MSAAEWIALVIACAACIEWCRRTDDRRQDT